jgi:HEAT repeat protein
MAARNTNSGNLTVEDLQTALADADLFVRLRALERFRRQRAAPEAIPVLMGALSDDEISVVRVAADCLRKLGPAAEAAAEALLEAGDRISPSLGSPQAYMECIEALAAIQPQNPGLLPLIRKHVRFDNWLFLAASLRALKVIGTAEALAVMHEEAEVAVPELNTQQRKNMERIVNG